jgi:hypothetical protein
MLRAFLTATFILVVDVAWLHAVPVEVTFGSPYTQNFNLLSAGANNSTSSVGIPDGWGFSELDSNANTTYRVSDGRQNTGDTYSYGTLSSSDRAFGSLLSANLQSTILFNFKNKSGQTIESLDVAFRGELWRRGLANRTDTLAFSYSFNGTTWTSFSSLNYTSPAGATLLELDGNAVGNFTNVSATLSSLYLANDQEMWFRWVDLDAATTSADDGMGIDDFSMSANFTVVPEPGTLTIYSLAGLTTFVGVAWRRRHAKKPQTCSP